MTEKDDSRFINEGYKNAQSHSYINMENEEK